MMSTPVTMMETMATMATLAAVMEATAVVTAVAMAAAGVETAAVMAVAATDVLFFVLPLQQDTLPLSRCQKILRLKTTLCQKFQTQSSARPSGENPESCDWHFHRSRSSRQTALYKAPDGCPA